MTRLATETSVRERDMRVEKGIRGIGRVAIAATLAGLLGFGSMAIPTQALAATTTKSYTWQDGEQQPSAAQTITEGGKTYTLSGTSTPKKSGSDKTVTQSFTTTQSGTATDVNGVTNAVPTSTSYSSDGYSGTLQRKSVNYTPVYTNVTQTETGQRSSTTNGSADNHPDDSVAPSSITQNGHQLNRTGVSWEKVDTNGTGALWRWTAQYSGNYQVRKFDHYNVTGTYSGTLSKKVSGGTWSMTATYTAPDDAADNQNTGNTQTIDETQDAQNQNDDGNANDNANGDDSDSDDESNENAKSGYERQNTNGNKDSSDNGEKTGFLGFVGKHPLLLLIPVILILAIIAAIVAAKRKKKAAGAVGAGAAAAAVIPADIYGLNAELVELVPDGTDGNQRPIATCDAFMSPDKDTPTLIEIPQPPQTFEPALAVDENGVPIMDEDGNQMQDDYYVLIGDTSYDATATGVTDENGIVKLAGIPDGDYVISVADGPAQSVTIDADSVHDLELIVGDDASDISTDAISREDVGLVPGDNDMTVTLLDANGDAIADRTVDVLADHLLDHAQSNRLVIESNGHRIYDGDLARQVKVETKLLTDALNDVHSDGEDTDITADVDRWMTRYEDYDASRDYAINAENERREQEAQAAEDDSEQHGATDDDYAQEEPADADDGTMAYGTDAGDDGDYIDSDDIDDSEIDDTADESDAHQGGGNGAAPDETLADLDLSDIDPSDQDFE